MRIAHLSDFHFTRLTCNPLRLCSKRLFGHLNWLVTRKSAFSETQLMSLVPLFTSLQIDLLLLGGDFTTTALQEEFEAAAAFFTKLPQPKIAIAGNHDHYTFRSFRRKEFYRYFANAPSLFPFSLRDHGVEAHEIGKQWWVVALDTSRATFFTSSRGLFSPKLEENLETVLRAIPPKEKVLLLNHYPFFQNDVSSRTLERGEALEALLRHHPHVRAYLHGHTHRHTIADLQPNGLPLILDSGSVAQKSEGSWNLLDLSEEACRVTVYRWKNKWTPEQKMTIPWRRS